VTINDPDNPDNAKSTEWVIGPWSIGGYRSGDGPRVGPKVVSTAPVAHVAPRTVQIVWTWRRRQQNVMLHRPLRRGSARHRWMMGEPAYGHFRLGDAFYATKHEVDEALKALDRAEGAGGAA
jgi:hypothetical protein